jgi:hypothetical protein
MESILSLMNGKHSTRLVRTEESLISGICTIRVLGFDIDRQGAELLLLAVSAKALKKGRANNV